jgi:hypothetical protein
MSELMKNLGYNFPEKENLKEQASVLVKLLLIGAAMTIPLLLIMALAGWMDRMSGL